ncbi:translation initiation factor eIF-2B subunit alpha [Gonapodya sp. JEL0774]|nr:translation initiation factor eIF-2B subunit alpha [Gonapodya sp. JEL0774]
MFLHVKALTESIKIAAEKLKASTDTIVSVTAGCEAFLRFVRGLRIDATIEESKTIIISKGETFVRESDNRKRRIAELGANLIKDDMCLLVHSYSRVVMGLLRHAARANIRFRVFATEARPSDKGQRVIDELRECNIPVQYVSGLSIQVALSSILFASKEKVDLVLTGAEGVVENGGVVNSIGTLQIAVVAKAAMKPMYTVAEAYKFVRISPVGQYDLPQPTHPSDAEMKWGHPMVDFTPPEYISGLVTDLGILTPSAVSAELLRLWY